MSRTVSTSRQYGVKSEALSQFMSKVYTWMCIGILLSAGIAYYIGSTPTLAQSIVSSGMMTVLFIAQLACVFTFAMIQNRVSASTCILLYLAYAVLTGMTFSAIAFAYSQQTIAQAFFATAGSFFGLSLFGYTTKRDLGPVGTFCFMGLIGLVIVYLMGFFFPSIMSGSMSMLLGCVGVLIFAGLTAYDTQRIKSTFNPDAPIDTQAKMVINGALTLYLDFINLFLSMLRLFGGSRQ